MTGFQAVAQVETPGLGARISEPWFGAQFTGQKVPASGSFKFVNENDTDDADKDNETVDGVTGATITTNGTRDIVNKAVAEIVFSLEKPGDVSNVISRPEGVFLVRCMAVEPAFVRPFESVSHELEQAERQRMRAAVEADFDSSLKSRYPASPLAADATKSQVVTTP